MTLATPGLNTFSETISVEALFSQMRLAPGNLVSFENLSWRQFELILVALGEKRFSRIAYSNGLLEIAMPSPEHERPRDMISDLVKLLLDLLDQNYQPFGSTTFKKETMNAGVEPDACFYIQNWRSVVNRRRLEPQDPPPDLAIETDITSKTALEAYLALAVPELWIYDRQLRIYALQDNKYIEVENSPTLCHLPVQKLVNQVIDRSYTVGHSQALRDAKADAMQLMTQLNRRQVQES